MCVTNSTEWPAFEKEIGIVDFMLDLGVGQ